MEIVKTYKVNGVEYKSYKAALKAEEEFIKSNAPLTIGDTAYYLCANYYNTENDMRIPKLVKCKVTKLFVGSGELYYNLTDTKGDSYNGVSSAYVYVTPEDCINDILC